MFHKMLRNDIGRNKAISVTLCLFVTLASMLVAGAFSIIAEMAGAMDAFFEQAKPIHYMQMVSGAVDQEAIDDFSARHALVRAQQTLELLGIDNNYIYYGDNPEPFADSVMENSFVTQSPAFDFLLDENNNLAVVEPGQVAAPLFAISAYGLKEGDSIYIRRGSFEMRFTVKCFIRDSQMNASLVSSKRFLINEKDYALLKANIGEVEYLIEFQLADPSKTGEFDADYLAAGMPSGIAITLPVIQLMNAMTGGLAVVVLIVASILLIVIAVMCLRFTILAALEEEYREIGVMKAIGLAPKYIGKLYKAKYYLLGAVSCVLGFVLSLFFSSMFTQSVSLYMGKADVSGWAFVLPLLGAVAVFAIISGSCSAVLRRLRKVSAVDAIRGAGAAGGYGGHGGRGGFGGKALPVHRSKIRNVNIFLGVRDVVGRLRDYKTPIIVFAICAFLVTVPVNFLNTINSPDFVRYTGVGYCDAIITLRYSDDIEERYSSVLETLAADKDVSVFSGRVTANYKTLNPDGNYENISIQNGDFSLFPIAYLHGGAPAIEGEIALSSLNARDFGKNTGDIMEIIVDGTPVRLTVCGVYQDLTNGGKSAQAHLPYRPENVLWYTAFLDFVETVDVASKTESYGELFAPAKVVEIDGYITETFVSTIRQFEDVTRVVFALSIAVAALVTALFLRLVLAKDRGQITIMKGLGFTYDNIRAQYVSAVALSLVVGVALGMIAANTLGEALVGALMSSMGASRISFVINPLVSLIACPAALLAAVLAATLLSTRSVRQYKNYIVIE